MEAKSNAFLMLIKTVAGIAYNKGYYGPDPTDTDLAKPKPEHVEEHRAEVMRAIPQVVIEGMVSNMVKTMTKEEEEVTPKKGTE